MNSRLQLLHEAEIEDLYARPDFNADERELYFEMNRQELDALNQYSTTKTRVSFILQLAYFKAKQQFFTFTLDEVNRDVAYVLTKYFNIKNVVLPSKITRQSLNQQKNVILNLFGYQDWLQQQAELALDHLCELIRYYPKGHDAFRQLLVYFDKQKFILPTGFVAKSCLLR